VGLLLLISLSVITLKTRVCFSELPAAVLQDCGNDATGGISLGGNRTGGPLTTLHLVEIESMESNDQPATRCHLLATGSSTSESDSSGGLVWHELAGGL